MWPWTSVRERLDLIAAQVQTIRELVSRPAPPPARQPSPFVCVLVDAEAMSSSGETFTRTTLGASGYVKDRDLTLTMTAFRPLRRGRVIVFCDLELVTVTGIFAGIDVLTSTSPTEAPTAFFDDLPVGVK